MCMCSYPMSYRPKQWCDSSSKSLLHVYKLYILCQDCVNVHTSLSLHSGIFLGLILGRISASSQFKNEQKLPKMVHINYNFLVLHFGENFMKIRTKIPKLQMHDNLHKNLNENKFSFSFFMKIFMSTYGGQLKQQICYSFTLLILICC